MKYVKRMLSQPAYLTYAGLSAVCLVNVGMQSLADLFMALGIMASTLVLILLTFVITKHLSLTGAAKSRHMWPTIVQTGAALLVILLTFLQHSLYIPGWGNFTQWLFYLENVHGIASGSLANPVLYFLPIAIILLATRASWRELGFTRGQLWLGVTILWCVVPFSIVMAHLLWGGLTLGALLVALVLNILRSGFFEEFLFRGVLFTRLEKLVATDWAIVLSAIAFGLWHGWSNAGHHGLLFGLALGVLNQGIGGIGFGLVFAKTRSIIPTSIIHIVSNVAFG